MSIQKINLIIDAANLLMNGIKLEEFDDTTKVLMTIVAVVFIDKLPKIIKAMRHE